MLWHMSDHAVSKITPLLVVQDAASAIEFYVEALRATETVRYMDRRKGTVSHADLVVGGAAFSVTEEARAWKSNAPPSLGGSPVILQLHVGDVDAVFKRMCGAGATVVFPLVEFCGERMGRMRDPFGHIWILSQRVEDLSPEETQRRRDAWAPLPDSR
jgi:PhnB protein